MSATASLARAGIRARTRARARARIQRARVLPVTGRGFPWQQPGVDDAPGEPELSRLSLRANFSWTFAGNLVAAASQWGLLVALAKLGSPRIVGQYALGLAIATPVMMLANLQLRGIQATDTKKRYAFADYLGLRLLTSALAFATIAAIVFSYGLGPDTAALVLAVGIAKVLEAASDVLFGLFQQHERMDRVAISGMLKGPLALAFLVGALALTGSVVLGALGIASAFALVLLAYDLPNAARIAGGPALRPRLEPRTVASLLGLAAPLGLVMMLLSLNASIPRFFLEKNGGEENVGIFAALSYLSIVGTTVVGALGQAATPRLASAFSRRSGRAVLALLGKLVAIAALVGLAGVATALLFGRQLLGLFYGPVYAAHAPLLVWLMAAGAVSHIASVLGYSMTAARCFRVQVPIFAVVSGVTALACSVLVPRVGLEGAALATGLAAVTALLGASAVNARALLECRRFVEVGT